VKPLRIGTRGSRLALWQANFIRERLASLRGAAAEIVILKTTGDRFQQTTGQAGVPFPPIGMKGVFIKELEDALLENRVDLAVHSMKDVPTQTPPGLVFPAICKREDPRDCLVSWEGKLLAELDRGARVGTSSLRRQAQLRHVRPELELTELRGNVDTRLRKLDRGDYDAIVLAKAGLDRLGWSARITEVLPPEVSLPAVGQGALGIEAREGDADVKDVLASLDDPETRQCVLAERALLAELEGGCQVPLGAWARMEGGRLVLDACVLSPDGTDYLRRQIAGLATEAERLGRQLARTLLDAGADRILKLVGRAR
jgi:hydroxymethylbilane synthase